MKFLKASISINKKRMDDSDVSAPASPADYIPYFSLALYHLVSPSIDPNAAIVLNLYNSEITSTTSV